MAFHTSSWASLMRDLGTPFKVQILRQDNAAAVPKFGEWNDRDAATPNNYTAIFNQVRQERQEAARGAELSSTPSNNNIRNSEPNKKKCCCFPWSRRK